MRFGLGFTCCVICGGLCGGKGLWIMELDVSFIWSMWVCVRERCSEDRRSVTSDLGP